MCFNMLIRNKQVYTYIHYRWVQCNSNEPVHFHMKMKIIPIIVILEKLFSFSYEIISTRAYTVKMPAWFGIIRFVGLGHNIQDIFTVYAQL